MAQKIEYDTGDAALVTTELAKPVPTFPTAIPAISDPASIVEAFTWLWQGADVVDLPSGAVPGVAGYLNNFHSRLENLESATQVQGTSEAVNLTMTPQDTKFLLKKSTDATALATFVVATAPATTASFTLPAASDTLVGTAANQTLTNKTFSGGTINNSAQITNTTINNSVIGGTTPVAGTFTTLTGTTSSLGVATATTLNKVTVTAPATAATLTLANNSSLITVGAYSITLTATNTTSITLPTSGTLAITGNPLSQFASTTSAQLAGVISDETGSAGGGVLVFSNSPALTSPAITGGTVNNAVIGGTTPAAGSFTTLNASGAVAGSSTITGTRLISTIATGTAPLGVTSTTAVTNLNSDLLDDQHGAYYLDWTNATNKPSPVITLAGDLTGSVTLTNVTSGTLTATIAANSVALGTDTTGNYVATITSPGSTVTVGNSGSESAAVTIDLPQSISSAAQPTFAGLTVNGDFTVTGNYVISGTTEYDGASIKTGKYNSVSASQMTLDSFLVADFDGYEYLVTLKNATGKTVYRLTVASFADAGPNNETAYNVYSEISAGNNPPTGTFGETHGDTTSTITITPSAVCNIRFFRIATKAA